MRKEAKSKVTIDDLAVMVAKGFEEVATKTDFRELKKEIEGVKNQLEGTNKRIDAFTETKVSKTEHKALDHRVGFVEKKLGIGK